MNSRVRSRKQLRCSLITEQGGLCCYCMGSIFPEKSKIEHLVPQSKSPELVLSYNNLFAACEGGQGRPPSDQHCDTKKGGQEISINLLENIEPHIRYTKDSRILTERLDFKKDINETLNLNHPKLVANRRDALNGLLKAFQRSRPGGWSKSFIERQLNLLRTRNNKGWLTPYCQVMIYFLEKRLHSPR